MTNFYKLTLLHFNDPSVAKAWNEMETGQLSPYLHYRYMSFICRYTSLYTFYRPRVACISDSAGKIVMMVPLKGSLTLSYFKMLGDIQGCDRTDALYHPSLSAAERDEATRYFYGSMRCKMKLHRLQEGSPMVSMAPEDRIRKAETNPYVRIAVPADHEAHLKSLSPSVRQNLRTAYNRMRRDGKEFTSEILGGGVPVSNEVWKEIMDLYFTRLFSKYKKAKASNPLSLLRWKIIYYRLKHDTLSLKALPNARHILLRDSGRLVAFMSGFLTADGSCLTIPRLAIDGEYRFYSPGYILLDQALRLLEKEGSVTELDMSRGDEKYKFDMGGSPYITTDLDFRSI